ncbi:hypothetical protein DEU56DRAFT_792096 [Suillus clintonianus]|uniref:uncharacterized protein n=1 Tax=Suillus clintonianus TaxID=1904413 RepID=UPI001B86BFDA|nr:uncharacterized protein DEU56DRAFT_792096 [Suillus clintonianus]KAG2143702.1 hypothetical protein DEU56DRAFT_792096 [Suillus clintonianus]
MTSNLPPTITPVPAGTPPTEWANKTKSMFQSDVVTPDPAMMATPKPEQPEHPVTTTTNLNTPGHEFPGSYPRELEQEQERQQHTRGNGSEGPAGASVVQTAKQYIQEPVERSVEYAGQTAAAYLPIPQGVKNTVASYWSSDDDSQPKGTQTDQHLSTSLPSSELKGAQPCEHVGGVGSLPGTISESSVALLPDERAEKYAQTPVNLKKDDSQTRGNDQVKSAAFLAGTAAVAGKPESSNLSKDPSSRAASTQYRTQTESQQLDKSRTTQQTDQRPSKLSEPKPVSVDNNPKHDVPEGERSHDAEIAGAGGAATGAAHIRDKPSDETPESKAAQTAVAGGAVGASELAKEARVDDKAHDKKEALANRDGAKVSQQFGGKELADENRKGDVGKVPDDTASDEDIKHTHKAGAHTAGYDTDYHPAKLHPPRTVESTDKAEVQSGSPVPPTSAPPASVADSPKERRVSFLDRIRGEAKIIAGKVSGKEDKVEEGKRMMHGEV